MFSKPFTVMPSSLVALAVLVVAWCLCAGPAHAQATRTWVSGVGDDANSCARTEPCKTFAGAISKTAAGGEINCLDPGGFGTVTIAKSIQINCTGTLGGVLAAGVNGVIVNASNGLVRLKGLDLNGATNTPSPAGLSGIRILNATEVIVEDCLIDGFDNFGIADVRTSAGSLGVYRTTISNVGQAGIGIAPGAGGAVVATVDKVNVFRSGAGIGIGGTVQMQVRKSSFSTGLVGVQADAGAALSINGSVITQNNTGVVGNGTVRIGDTDISFNSTGSTGTFQSFVNNRFTSNGSFGSVTQVSGGVTNPQGLN